ncbi:hypothetical protein LJR118_006598 [Acidovorax sp. LjRoot118]|uniref:recombination directionality factor n=1 Tax=Acidovorax sp. LjRoot118 TaxID=3342256 RepID=UPI003ECCF735
MNLSADKIGPFTEGRVQIVTPEDDGECHFVITGHAHQKMTDGEVPAYAEHPVAEKVAPPGARLREIPVKVMFDQVNHNLFTRYEAWSPGVPDMPVCIGDGAIANAVNVSTGQRHAHVCKGPSLCRLMLDNNLNCSISVRMPVLVQGVPLELRSNAVNTLAALTAKLTELRARFGGLRHLSLKLRIWEKSTRASSYRRFGCATIDLDADAERAEVCESTDDRNDGYGGAMQRAWAATFVPSAADMRPEPALCLSVPAGAPRPAVLPIRTTQAQAGVGSMFSIPLETAMASNHISLQ